MLTDAEIEARCAEALPILGPTRTRLLREVLLVGDTDPYGLARNPMLWVVRTREVLSEMVELVQAVRWAMESLPDPHTIGWTGYCKHCATLTENHQSTHQLACPWLKTQKLLERYRD